MEKISDKIHLLELTQSHSSAQGNVLNMADPILSIITVFSITGRVSAVSVFSFFITNCVSSAVHRGRVVYPCGRGSISCEVRNLF